MAKNTRAQQQKSGRPSAQKVSSKQPVPQKSSRQAPREIADSVTWIDRFESSVPFLRSVSPFWIAVLVNAVLFGITYIVFKPQFNTGDDRAMMFLSAGKLIALEPTEYLIFTNIIIGHVLKALYTAFPSVSWYPIYLIAGLFLGYTALLYAILKRRPGIVSLMVYCVSFVVIGAYMLLELQFTMTATIVGFGGMALLLMQRNDDEQDLPQSILARLRSGAGITGIILVILSAMIRWQSFLLVLVCVLPVVVIGLLVAASRRHSLVVVSLVIVACSFAGGTEIYHRYRYDHWGTFNYLEFNRLYGEFSDFKRYRRITFTTQQDADALLKNANNWSVVDFEMFMNEFYMGNNLYSIDNMRLLLKACDDYERDVTKDPSSQSYYYLKQGHEEQTTKFWKRQWALVQSDGFRCAVALLIVGVVLAEIELGSLLGIFAVMGTILGVLAYVNYMTLMRDPADRVFYPLWLYVSMLGVLFTKPRGTKPVRKGMAQLNNVLSIIALFAIGYCIWYGTKTITNYGGITEEIRGGEGRLRKAIETLSPKKENLYVIWAYGFPFRDMPPFCDLRVFDNFHALWLMWAQRTPTTKQLLDSYDIHDVYYDIPRRQNILFLLSLNQIISPQLNYLALFNDFIHNHYGYYLAVRDNSQKFITNISEGKNGNPYTTFQTIGADTVAPNERLRALEPQPTQ
jgi:hypothetical protein